MNPTEVLNSSDVRPSKKLTIYAVFARQGSSFCYGTRLNLPVYAFGDIKMAARLDSRVAQKTSYSPSVVN